MGMEIIMSFEVLMKLSGHLLYKSRSRMISILYCFQCPDIRPKEWYIHDEKKPINQPTIPKQVPVKPQSVYYTKGK